MEIWVVTGGLKRSIELKRGAVIPSFLQALLCTQPSAMVSAVTLAALHHIGTRSALGHVVVQQPEQQLALVASPKPRSQNRPPEVQLAASAQHLRELRSLGLRRIE